MKRKNILNKLKLEMENSLPKFWRSKKLIDNANNKLFTNLSVYAEKDIKFTLLYDNKSISFTTYKDGLNQFAFKIMCKNLKLEIMN